MWPGAAVSGLYFSHPQSQYFVLGHIGRDQVEDYARRKGWTTAEAERGSRPTWVTALTTNKARPSSGGCAADRNALPDRGRSGFGAVRFWRGHQPKTGGLGRAVAVRPGLPRRAP